MRITAAYAQFVLFCADTYTGTVLLDYKGIDAVAAFGDIRLRHHQVNGGGIPVGDPVLYAVEQIVVPFVFRRSALGSGITAGFRCLIPNESGLLTAAHSPGGRQGRAREDPGGSRHRPECPEERPGGH